MYTVVYVIRGEVECQQIYRIRQVYKLRVVVMLKGTSVIGVTLKNKAIPTREILLVAHYRYLVVSVHKNILQHRYLLLSALELKEPTMTSWQASMGIVIISRTKNQYKGMI